MTRRSYTYVGLVSALLVPAVLFGADRVVIQLGDPVSIFSSDDEFGLSLACDIKETFPTITLSVAQGLSSENSWTEWEHALLIEFGQLGRGLGQVRIVPSEHLFLFDVSADVPKFFERVGWTPQPMSLRVDVTLLDAEGQRTGTPASKIIAVDPVKWCQIAFLCGQGSYGCPPKTDGDRFADEIQNALTRYRATR